MTKFTCHDCNKIITKDETYLSDNAKHFKRCKYCNGENVYLYLEMSKRKNTKCMIQD